MAFSGWDKSFSFDAINIDNARVILDLSLEIYGETERERNGGLDAFVWAIAFCDCVVFFES